MAAATTFDVRCLKSPANRKTRERFAALKHAHDFCEYRLAMERDRMPVHVRVRLMRQRGALRWAMEMAASLYEGLIAPLKENECDAEERAFAGATGEAGGDA